MPPRLRKTTAALADHGDVPKPGSDTATPASKANKTSSKFPKLLIYLAGAAFVFALAGAAIFRINTAEHVAISSLDSQDAVKPSSTILPDVAAADQATPITAAHDTEQELESKRNAVREAFRTSWQAYGRDAFGYDNYHPISQKGSNLASKPIGYYIVDCLDSLLLFDMPEEYARARKWVADELDFDTDDKHHAFEVTIRVLGGLLAAYHLSDGDKLYLNKAVDLADRLLPIFDTPTGVPLSFINLHQRKGLADADNYNFSSVAEAGTLQLEFKYLAHLTGEREYWDKVERIMDVMESADKQDGLVPLFINPSNGLFEISDIRLGSRADSYYEYLLKQYLQTGQTQKRYAVMFMEALGGIQRNLLRKSNVGKTVYTQELVPAMDPLTKKVGVRQIPKQDHLVCFIGGLMMLGTTNGRPAAVVREDEITMEQKIYWTAGQALTKTCMDTYTQSNTGLGAEIVHYFNEHITPKRIGDRTGRAWFIKRAKGGPPPHDAKYMLRPETVESIFVSWRLTGDPIYRDWGWRIFQAIEKHCKVATGGYATLKDVDSAKAGLEDRMETFFLSETLKYLYLLFSDNSIWPLDRYVFNTEAHPLPIFMPEW